MAGPTFPIWPFRPNWQTTLSETLSWKTDVLTSKTGREQRRKLRLYPRKQIEYFNLMTMRERAMHDSLMNSFGVHDWMLPLWHDVHHLDFFHPAGMYALFFPTTLLGEFRAGGFVMVTAGDKFKYEICQVAYVNDNALGLVDLTSNAWPIGSRVYPLQRARMLDMPQMSRRSDATFTGSYKFMITEPDVRYYLPRQFELPGLIVKGLVARRYLEKDTAPYDAEAGVTIGQASMALAALKAFNVLALDSAVEGRETSDGYKVLGLDLLDKLLGTGSPNGAIIRQPRPTNGGTITIPHWLYAARGPVDSLADQGEGYEVFPAVGELSGGFASAAPETFRDLDRALNIALYNDDRQTTKPGQWAVLREALRVTNLRGRQISDGRQIFFQFPGGPVVPRGNQEPKGNFTRSTNPFAAEFNAGISGGVTGSNFFSRDANGDILMDVPTAYDYNISIDIFTINPETYKDSSGKKIVLEGSGGLGSTVTKRVIVTRSVELGRFFPDKWRQATTQQKADQYLLIQYAVSRDIIDDEEIMVEVVIYNVGIYRAALPRTGNGNLRTVLIAREDFKHDVTGGNFPAGSLISEWKFKIIARMAYTARVSGMRMLSGGSAASVSGNVNAAIQGEALPYLPGANPFRISGATNPGVFTGYAGSPWTGAQTPDVWGDLVGRTTDFLNPAAGSLATADINSGAIIYPIAPNNDNGKPKTAEALLAEQNLHFLRNAMERHKADANGKNGPMAFTFVSNRPDRLTDFGDIGVHSWLYANARTDDEVFYQARSIEGVARMARLATSNGDKVTYNGEQITVNGQDLYAIYDGEDALIGFDQIDNWQNVTRFAREIVYDFLQWFNAEWTVPSEEPIMVKGNPLIFNGETVVIRGGIDTSSFSNPPSHYAGPGFPLRKEAPHTVALVMRTCMWMATLKDENRQFYINIARNCYRYLSVRINTLGTTFGIPYFSTEEIRWYVSEYILTAAELKQRPAIAAEICGNEDVPRQWLIKAHDWLLKEGVDVGNRIYGFDRNYKGYAVLTDTPNETDNMSIDIDRLTEEYDNQITMPTQVDYDPNPYNRPQYSWFKVGREASDSFRRMLYSMQGRALPFWLPTHMRDVQITSPIAQDDVWLTIENIGYTVSGGPRRTRRHIMIVTYDLRIRFREILESQEIDERTERLRVDRVFRSGITIEDVKRISFMDLSRLDQDGVQIQHPTDVDGVTSATTVFRSVKA